MRGRNKPEAGPIRTQNKTSDLVILQRPTVSIWGRPPRHGEENADPLARAYFQGIGSALTLEWLRKSSGRRDEIMLILAPRPLIRSPPVDACEYFQASLQVPASHAPTLFTSRRNRPFRSPEYAVEFISRISISFLDGQDPPPARVVVIATAKSAPDIPGIWKSDRRRCISPLKSRDR